MDQYHCLNGINIRSCRGVPVRRGPEVGLTGQWLVRWMAHEDGTTMQYKRWRRHTPKPDGVSFHTGVEQSQVLIDPGPRVLEEGLSPVPWRPGRSSRCTSYSGSRTQRRWRTDVITTHRYLHTGEGDEGSLGPLNTSFYSFPRVHRSYKRIDYL